LGTRSVDARGSRVVGQVRWPESIHLWMDARSNVAPVGRLTGDRITSSEIGHRNAGGVIGV
jgi:hypothetical protein